MNLKIFFSICFVFIVTTLLSAQGQPWCGAEVSPYEAEHMSFLNDEIQAFTQKWIAEKATRKDPPVSIPIKAHFFNNTSGVYGMDSATLVKAIDTLNKYMAPANMQFYICGAIDYLDLKTSPVNTSIFYTKHPAYSTKFNYPYVVNIYFAAGLIDGSLSSSLSTPPQ
jgi:hypothetical protein